MFLRYCKNVSNFKVALRQKGFYETTTLPSHQHLSDARGENMHLLPAGADGKQLDVFGCGFLCPAAEGIKPFFKRADVGACLERRVEPFFPACKRAKIKTGL